jgi:very-short-patch-repair endonuclease
VVARTLRRLGGTASWGELARVHARGDLERAVAADAIIRVRRGLYAVRVAADARTAAERLAGVAVLHSAAAHWRWKMQWTPTQPTIAVRRGRKLTKERREGLRISWRSYPPADLSDGWVTTPVRTVVDCAARLPFPEALAIADSALRSGLVDREVLHATAAALDGYGFRGRVLRVVEAASPDAHGPFESVLRAHVLGLHAEFEPQVRIDDEDGFVGRVDLADTRLRIVLEAESLEFHGEKAAFDKDCERYTRLTAAGWLVLRFTWTQVMTQPERVRTLVERAIALRACTPTTTQA